jgi:hypothetical protein
MTNNPKGDYKKIVKRAVNTHPERTIADKTGNIS